MSRLEIPGYYFDEEKGKYFKIVKSHLAPSTAAYSSDNVKRRKLEDEANRAADRRKRLLRNHIRRHAFLSNDSLTSSLLDHEVGAASRVKGLGARVSFEYGDKEMRGRCWAKGLEGKGEVSFAPSFVRGRMANMGCFWVDGGDEVRGMGVGYGGLDEETLVGSYIPTDENERICFSRDSTYMRPLEMPSYRTEIVRCPQMSSIKYHAPSHKILLTSRELDHSAGLYIFSPPLSEEGSGQPRWLLGEANQYQRLSTLHRLRDQWVVHGSTPAPPSLPSTLCVLGTNAGLLRVSSSEAVSWLSSPPSENSSSPSHHGRKTGPQLPREIFSQDFQLDNPNVLYAGGRQPRLWRTDLRTGGREWGFELVESSLAHVKSLNGGREVLVAGPRDLMAIYDVRMFGRGSSAADLRGSRTRGGKGVSRPVVTFPEHKNEAHIHTGLDVSHDLGIVAAGQGDGTVKLFSTMSGRMLKIGGGGGHGKASGKKKEKAGYGGLESVKTDTPIKAVMFQRMPWERWESLWVAEGPALRKFSFGAREWEDEV